MSQIRPSHITYPLRGLLFAVVFGLACATPELKPSGFLNNYTSLQYEKDSSVYYSDPPTNAAAMTHIVVLRDPQWRAGEGVAPEFAQELCQVLKARLAMRIHQQIEGVVVFERESDLASLQGRGRARIMLLECAITRIEDGVGVGRYLVGYGLGDAKITVETRATLTASPQSGTYQVVAFARSNGNPNSGLNPRSMSANYTMRLACDSAATQIAEHLAGRLRPPGARWWATLYEPKGNSVDSPSPASSIQIVSAAQKSQAVPNAEPALPLSNDSSSRISMAQDAMYRSQDPSAQYGAGAYPALPLAGPLLPLPSPGNALIPRPLTESPVAGTIPASSAAPFRFAVRKIATLMPAMPGSVLVVLMDYSLEDGASGQYLEIDETLRLIREGKTLAFKQDSRSRRAGEGRLEMLFQIPPDFPPGGCELDILIRAAGSTVNHRGSLVISAPPV